MNFQSYTELIKQSVADSGYDGFLPSLGLLNDDKVDLNVLDTELHEDGEKAIALDWASQYTECNRKLFCAYRIGNRCVEVVEVTGTEVTDKIQIEIRPYLEGQ